MLTPRRAVQGFVAVAAIALVARPGAAARTDSLRSWLDGPVHYIISTDELKEFKALKTDPDRAAFIERFWRKRDPNQSTLANEYRQFFWNRVREANEKFLDSPGPGCLTDRGKIYILYGPPDEVQDDPNAKATNDQGDGKGFIRWIYTKPGGRTDVNPVVYVPFVRDVSGQYRLSYDPKLASPFFTMNQLDDNRTVGLGGFLNSIQHSLEPIGVMLDLGKMQEVPPQESIILDSVESVETYAFEPLPLSIHRFQPPGKQFLAVVTIGIPGSAGVDPPSIIARFSIKGGAAKDARVLGEGSFRIEGEGEERVAQGRVLLAPGPWEVTVLAVDPATGISRIFRGHLDPPAAAPALRLSDIALSRSMGPLPYASQASYDDPYIIGGFHVTPRVLPQVRRGIPVQIFFEVYSGVAPYHVAYQLEGQEKDGRWLPLGKPQESDASERGQGYALPTAASWPLGPYRLRVSVTDSAGAKTSGQIAWTLVADPAP